MCRWLSYMGEPVWLEELVTRPNNSLIMQSLNARMGHTTTNGDGFGVGWYGDRPIPGLFREIMPAWNDPNLLSLAHQLRARLFFAHVRASTGTASNRVNCHPFASGPWLFMHNGQIGGYQLVRRRLEGMIPDSHYVQRVGTTDSELFFYLLFRHDLEQDPVGALARTIELVEREMCRAGISEGFRMTAALTDGRRFYALRHSSNPNPPTLFFDVTGGNLTVVSEPIDARESWTEVPADHVLVAEGDAAPALRAL